ncbi:MAG TPA: T9SS type A sorting domain-containing protein [Flavobacteriaceae bacterium]|nr:T9SS type A sorting domain-containing protein [Flavobacteriaceae bacterium]
MKAIINSIIFTSLLLIPIFLNAQEVDNPQEELVNQTWYVTKLEIGEEEHPLPSSNPELQGVLDTYESTYDESDFEASINYCDACGGGFVFVDENQFEMYDFACLASDGCEYGPSEENIFNSHYIWDIWTGENYPASFYFSITETEGVQQLIVTNENGDKAYFQDAPYLSIGKNSKPNFVLYPNPTKDFLSIDNIDQTTTVVLFSISGKQVLHQEIKTSSEKLDLADLSSGIYFYRISTDAFKEVQIGKLIKD